MILRAVTGTILISLSTGCPLVDIEVEVDAVCTSAGRIELEGVSGFSDMAVLERSLDISEEANEIRDALERFGATSASLHLTGLDIGVHDAADISFIDGLAFSLHTPARPELPALPVYTCDTCPSDPADIALSADPIELMAYIETGALQLDTEIRGHLPEQAWSLSVDLCFESTAKLQH